MIPEAVKDMWNKAREDAEQILRTLSKPFTMKSLVGAFPGICPNQEADGS